MGRRVSDKDDGVSLVHIYLQIVSIKIPSFFAVNNREK